MYNMIDTLILIYASRRMTGKESAAHKQMCDASEALLKRLPEVAISAVSWFEFTRGAAGHEDPKKLQAIEEKLLVLALDRPIATKASQLMRTRQILEKSCAVCLGAGKERVCTKCTRVSSTVQRINDALMVATAELTTSVHTLYSYDGGVLAYAPVLSACKVIKPAHADGPLFDRTKAPQDVTETSEAATLPASVHPVADKH